MRILQVIDRLNIGGAERIFLNVTQLLLDKGVDVSILLFHEGYPLDMYLDSRAKKYVINRVNKYSLSKLYQTFKICSSFDIVHVHMRHCYSYIRLAQIIFGGKYKVIIHDHYGDIDIDRYVPLGLKYFLKPKYYIGVSKSLVEWANSCLGIDESKIFLLANTILSKGQAIASGNKINVVVVSNFRKTKNVEFIIEVVKRLGWQCTIYGNKSDTLYYDKIMALIGDDTNIRVEEGVTDISGMYSQYDFAIHAAQSETGPLVLLEYMANGIPFLAYRTGDVARITAEDLPMCYIDSFDIEEWLKRINSLHGQQLLPEKLKTIFNKYFSPDKYFDECIRIYKCVAGY